MKISFHAYYFLLPPLVNTFRFLLCKIINTTRNGKKDEKIILPNLPRALWSGDTIKNFPESKICVLLLRENRRNENEKSNAQDENLNKCVMF